MVACFYCDKIDIFTNLQGHHKHRHYSEIFVVVDKQNKSKCGLCHKIYSTSEMILHFKTHHDLCHLNGITNPVCFTQNEIEQLFILNSCQEVSHQIAFMCGHCHTTKTTNEVTFIQHIEQDAFQFNCLVCPAVCNTIPKTVEHEKDTHNLTNTTKKHTNGLSIRLDRYHLRTRIQFSNGLVLFKHNLLNSSFDDRKEFFPLKERMIKHIESTEKPVRNVPFNSTNELNKQLSFRNDLCIKGFKTVNNDEQLRKICSHLCTAIGVNVTMDDIGSIYQRHGNDIIVRFKVLDVKKNILKRWESMSMADKLIKLKPLILIIPEIELKKNSGSK